MPTSRFSGRPDLENVHALLAVHRDLVVARGDPHEITVHILGQSNGEVGQVTREFPGARRLGWVWSHKKNTQGGSKPKSSERALGRFAAVP